MTEYDGDTDAVPEYDGDGDGDGDSDGDGDGAGLTDMHDGSVLSPTAQPRNGTANGPGTARVRR